MRSTSEINKEMERLVTGAPEPTPGDHAYTIHAVAAQALAWVLGDEISPSEMAKDEIEEAA